MMKMASLPKSGVFLVLLAYGGAACAETDHLTLEKSIELSRTQSPLVAESAGKSDLARGAAQESRAALLPHIGTEASYRNFTFNRETIGLDMPAFSGLDRVLGPVDDYTAKVQGKIDLINVSAWRKMRASDARYRAAELDTRIASEEAAYLVAQAYLQLAKARGEEANHKKSLAMAQSFLGLVQDQKAAGTATSLDVVRAQLQVNSAQTAVLSSGSEADRAKYGLLALLGYAEDREIVMDDSLSQVQVDFPLQEEKLVDLALGNRPEVKMEEKTIEASKHLIGAALSEYYPVLRAGAEIGVDGKALERMERVRNFGVTLDWSLWEGGASRAKAGQARAAAAIESARFREIRDRIAAQTRSALSAFKAAAQLVRTADDYKSLSQSDLDQSEQRFKSGLAGSLDVIDAQKAFIQAQNSRIEALFVYNTTRIALLRALGRLDSGQMGG
jgi:outer membrane protein